MKNYNEPEINDLVGLTFVSVTASGNEALTFTSDRGEVWEFSHNQDCCETVRIKDICGDLNDLVGSPLLMAEEVSSEKDPDDYRGEPHYKHYTWTFYKFATIKGSVTVRWLGESNGYHNESVSLHAIKTGRVSGQCHYEGILLGSQSHTQFTEECLDKAVADWQTKLPVAVKDPSGKRIATLIRVWREGNQVVGEWVAEENIL